MDLRHPAQWTYGHCSWTYGIQHSAWHLRDAPHCWLEGKPEKMSSSHNFQHNEDRVQQGKWTASETLGSFLGLQHSHHWKGMPCRVPPLWNPGWNLCQSKNLTRPVPNTSRSTFWESYSKAIAFAELGRVVHAQNFLSENLGPLSQSLWKIWQPKSASSQLT